MSVLKPRNRLVYFRVSEDEYQRFSNICESSGSRSLSDLARQAMESIVDKSSRPHVDICEKLNAVESMVNKLSDEIHELSVSLAWVTTQLQGLKEEPQAARSVGEQWR